MSDEMAPSVSSVASAALRSSLEDTGLIVTSYIGLVNYIGVDGVQCWSLVVSQETTPATDLGNVAFLSKIVDRMVEGAIDSASESE